MPTEEQLHSHPLWAAMSRYFVLCVFLKALVQAWWMIFCVASNFDIVLKIGLIDQLFQYVTTRGKVCHSYNTIYLCTSYVHAHQHTYICVCVTLFTIPVNEIITVMLRNLFVGLMKANTISLGWQLNYLSSAQSNHLLTTSHKKTRLQ